MIEMNYIMFCSVVSIMKTKYRIDEKIQASISQGFIEIKGFFVLRSYVDRLKTADMKFCMDETGVEIFVNDLTVYGRSADHLVAKMYMTSKMLIDKWKEAKFEEEILISMAMAEGFGRVRMHVVRNGQRYYRDDVVANTDVEFALIRI
jgi:hypothetical protein